ncbi:hypothetical protein UlMin_032419 [Ulmus minor]
MEGANSDAVKAEMKEELVERWKKAHSEQSLKFEEAKLQIEKQDRELTVKLEDIAEARRVNEKLGSLLQEKELSLGLLGSTNEKIRSEFEQKVTILEGEKEKLVSALDEVTARNKELEQKVCASVKEIEGLKKLLLIVEKKCSETNQMSQEAKELRQRDEVIFKLEDENRKIQDQLKWKKEQFKHLEEAHKKLQDHFQISKAEWEREKSALSEEISSLQTNLDSQTRILQGLQTRLAMCNQALAHEETKRKLLEAQVSDFESRFENVFSKFEEEKSEIQSLNIRRNEEIAELRNILGNKEALAKEMEFKIAHLEQENEELKESLKELREAQIKSAGATSSAKMLNKVRRLEQALSNRSSELKSKESEWISQIEKIKGDMHGYKFDLKGKEEEVRKLRMELESCHSAMEVSKEEISTLLVVFKSEIEEAYSKTSSAEKEEKHKALDVANLELEIEKKKVESLTKRVNSFQLMEQRQVLLEEELQQHKQMLEESSMYQLQLRKQLLQMEASAEDKENFARTVNEKDSCIENLRKNITELKQESMRRESEAATRAQLDAERVFMQEKETLLLAINEKDLTIKSLQASAISLDQHLISAGVSSFSDAIEKLAKIDVLTEALEKTNYVKNVEIEEKNKIIVDFEKEVCSSHQRLSHQEELLLSLKQEVEQLQALLETNRQETKKLMEGERRTKGMFEQLELDKGVLIQGIMKLSKERDEFLVSIQQICDLVGEFSCKDVEMMNILEKLLQGSKQETGPAKDLFVNDDPYDSTRENADVSLSAENKLEAIIDDRSPLKEVNH